MRKTCKRVISVIAILAMLWSVFLNFNVNAKADTGNIPEVGDSVTSSYGSGSITAVYSYTITKQPGWDSDLLVYLASSNCTIGFQDMYLTIIWDSGASKWKHPGSVYMDNQIDGFLAELAGKSKTEIEESMASCLMLWISGDEPGPGNPSTFASAPAHTHDFVTGTIYEATCEHDGLEGTYCKTCGFIKESSPISAFGYALYTDATQKITAAKSGQKIILEFKELNSFPKAFMEKIAARVAEGVSFEFRYNVNHELQKITIPAYSTVDTSLDWYGYAKMAELYGAN